MSRRKKVVDSSGNEVECYTIGCAAKYLDVPTEHLKLQLFKNRRIPYYKVTGRSGKRVIRIKRTDLDNFVIDQGMYDRISDHIRLAMKTHVQVIEGISQAQLAKELKITKVYMNYVINKKARISIKLLEKIAKILKKDLNWFVEE